MDSPAPILRSEELRRVARHMFARNGYAASSTRDLARELGILPGSLYSHIKSKEELLWEMILEAADLNEEVLVSIVQREAPAPERLHEAVVASIVLTVENLELAKVAETEWRRLSDERREIVRQRRAGIEALWGQLIKEGIDEGTFHCDPRIGRLFVLAVPRHVLQWFRVDGPLSGAQVAEQMADLALRALMCTEPR